jgi:hypothetical protein
MGTVIVGYFRYIGSLDFLIARRGHLECGREVSPQLKTMHTTGWIAFRHFLMDDAAAACHPLALAMMRQEGGLGHHTDVLW